MSKFKKNRARKGTALVISIFVSIVAALMTITMMGMVDTNTRSQTIKAVQSLITLLMQE